MSEDLAKAVVDAQRELEQAAYSVAMALQEAAATMVQSGEAFRAAMQRERMVTAAYIAALEKELSRQNRLS